MKPSEMNKDGNFSGRINKDVLNALKKIGMTPQKIIDAYVDAALVVEIHIRSRHERKKPVKRP